MFDVLGVDVRDDAGDSEEGGALLGSSIEDWKTSSSGSEASFHENDEPSSPARSVPRLGSPKEVEYVELLEEGVMSPLRERTGKLLEVDEWLLEAYATF